MRCLRQLRKAGGFTYVAALIAVALMSLVALGSVKSGSVIQQRSAEENLLAIGNEFRNAFMSYALATPAGRARMPATLEDLVKDPRFPNVRRHLRRIYVDPLTKSAVWGLVPGPGGNGIAGVYSLASGAPVKTGNFPSVYEEFSQASSYAQWKFTPPREMIEPTPGPTKRDPKWLP